MMSILFVFLGGMAGAVLRFEISSIGNKGVFPWGTAIANISGGMLLGTLIRLQESFLFPEWLWMLLAAGFCGGYTTHSTFSYEVFQFIRMNKWSLAVLYMISSIVLTLTGVSLLLIL